MKTHLYRNICNPKWTENPNYQCQTCKQKYNRHNLTRVRHNRNVTLISFLQVGGESSFRWKAELKVAVKAMMTWHWAAEKKSGKNFYIWKDDSLCRTRVNLEFEQRLSNRKIKLNKWFIRKPFGWTYGSIKCTHYFICKYILPQSRLSVTVMPHSDAASSACSLFRLAYRVFSGCRIGVRHDGYRLPGLK